MDDDQQQLQDGKQQNSGVSEAKSLARAFIIQVKGIEVELEKENIELTKQVGMLEAQVGQFIKQVARLEFALDNIPDCPEEDTFDAQRETDESLSEADLRRLRL